RRQADRGAKCFGVVDQAGEIRPAILEVDKPVCASKANAETRRVAQTRKRTEAEADPSRLRMPDRNCASSTSSAKPMASSTPATAGTQSSGRNTLESVATRRRLTRQEVLSNAHQQRRHERRGQQRSRLRTQNN